MAKNPKGVEKKSTEDIDEELQSVADEKSADKDVFTYIGGGADSPSVIKFMGIQTFMRGKPTVVKDPSVLKKIVNNPCFVRGEVPAELLVDKDEAAKKKEALQKAKNAAIQKAVDQAKSRCVGVSASEEV